MNFMVRGARPTDLEQLFELAKQFTLLNLPADKKTLSRKIEKSQASFAGQLKAEDSEYLFVVEDKEWNVVVASSQLLGKMGTPSSPNYSFQILKKEMFSKALGTGFIHQILRLKANVNGPSEIGGLVVDRGYRRRPEKIGKTASLIRFLFIAQHRSWFQDILHCEMAPPLTDDGRSEFWEALGRRFTGMPYWEADLLSQKNKEFIESLFPPEDIYLCLLDSKARLVLGQVSEQTRPALHMLEKVGFKYVNEVDPFDGGPHLQAKTDEISLVKQTRAFTLEASNEVEFKRPALLGLQRDGEFLGGQFCHRIQDNKIYLPQTAWNILELTGGEQLWCTPLGEGESNV